MQYPEKVELSPKEKQIMAQMAAAIRLRHESWRTADSYGWAVVHFYRWLQKHPGLAGESSEKKLTEYLSACAHKIGAKTQTQRLCAIKRYYEQVLQKPLGELPKWVYAKRPQRLPSWLNHAEIKRFLPLVTGTPGLMARLTYGAGLRLMEITRLRIQDIDLEQGMVFVRGGKGQKDRALPLPQSLHAPLAAQIQRVRGLWEADQARGTNPVQLPDTLARKYPNAGREWSWFWVFPGQNISRDPESGIVHRHHITRNCLQKAVQRAARLAAIPKRVTVHTLRHSFATHHLMRGTNIRELQELMGHSSVETTQIYTHVLPSNIKAAGSPLDDIEAVVVPFAPHLTTAHLRKPVTRTA
jgi:integron integrase